MTALVTETPWIVWTIALPLAGALASFMLPRRSVAIGLAAAFATAAPGRGAAAKKGFGPGPRGKW